jgi:hypothetical protein
MPLTSRDRSRAFVRVAALNRSASSADLQPRSLLHCPRCGAFVDLDRVPVPCSTLAASGPLGWITSPICSKSVLPPRSRPRQSARASVHGPARQGLGCTLQALAA